LYTHAPASLGSMPRRAVSAAANAERRRRGRQLRDGPKVTVVASQDRHDCVDAVLRYLGLGRL